MAALGKIRSRGALLIGIIGLGLFSFIAEEAFRSCLYSAGQPDPDLIIRTSGEQRISNYLTFQSAYSELYFTSTYWPDFTPEALHRALVEYAGRNRRFGLTQEQIQ